MHIKPRKSSVASGPKRNIIKPRVPPLRMRLVVVRDRAIGAGGGTFVPDLTTFKRQIMATKTKSPWTLVLAIHGSQDRLAAQVPGRPNHDVYYNAKKIAFIFGDAWRAAHAPLLGAAGQQSLVGQKWWDELFAAEDELGPRELPALTAVERLAGAEGWDSWRKDYGPTHLVLIACRVTKEFEGIMLSHFLRAGDEQTARGLGAGRKPLTEAETVLDFHKKGVTTRQEYMRLPKEERAWILDKLRDLNAKFGYYGAPPVKDEDILEYYFDVEPKGKWVKVTVGRAVHGQENLIDTGIPFFGR